MSAIEALHRGDLNGALARLKKEIQAAPDEPRHRVFLFQLYSVFGEWERALTQLNIVRDLDPDTKLMAQTYQEVLSCEVLRAEVFAGRRSPLILGEPDPWIAKAVEAQRMSAHGDYSAAAALRGEAWDEAAMTSGRAVVDQGDAETRQIEFEWIADSDTRLGPILEVIVDGRYYWVPIERIQRLEIDRPTDLRDFVWLPAIFTWTNEGQAAGMIPTRYPGSETHDDAEVRLSRRTEWREPAKETYEGLGQRVLTTGTEDFAIMNLRQINLDSSEGDPSA